MVHVHGVQGTEDSPPRAPVVAWTRAAWPACWAQEAWAPEDSASVAERPDISGQVSRFHFWTSDFWLKLFGTPKVCEFSELLKRKKKNVKLFGDSPTFGVPKHLGSNFLDTSNKTDWKIWELQKCWEYLEVYLKVQQNNVALLVISQKQELFLQTAFFWSFQMKLFNKKLGPFPTFVPFKRPKVATPSFLGASMGTAAMLVLTEGVAAVGEPR